MAGIERGLHSFSAGLIKNQNKLSQKKDSYSYALNAIKSSPIVNPSQLENEPGMKDIINLGVEFLLLGQIWLGLKQYVLFTKSLDNGLLPFNRIYYVDLDLQSNTIIYDTLNLNFLSTNEITGTYKVNYLNQRIVYWVDGVNQDRCLNIDFTSSHTIANQLPVEQLALDPMFNAAIISQLDLNDTGGRLMTGTYEFALRYRFQNYNSTTIFGLSLPISINESAKHSASNDYGKFDGNRSGILTSKSVNLTITDTDVNFKSLDLIVIRTADGSAVVTSINNIPYVAGQPLSYTFTGLERAVNINQGLSAVTVEPTNYYGSEVIAQKENRLLRGNLKQDKTILRYQQYANNVIVSIDTVNKVVMNTLADGSQTTTTQDSLFQYCSFDPTVSEYTLNVLRGEVYSLGMSFILTTGIETAVFHIPGRQAVAADLTVIANTTSPTWMVKDTNQNSPTNLSYWQSKELYPDKFDYPVGNIRHHKIPKADVLPLTSVTNNILSASYIELKFSNIQLPAEILSQVTQIKFYMTPRDLDSNKSITAKGAFIRTAISGADVTYTGNPKQHTTNVSPRYVVAASPFSGLPDDIYLEDESLARRNQRSATYANVKLNMSPYGLDTVNNAGVATTDISDYSLPSPNVSYAKFTNTNSTAISAENNKSFLFFHSPDTDPKIDNNDIPALAPSNIYLEGRMQGSVNWFLNTGNNNGGQYFAPPRTSNAFGVGTFTSATVDFKGHCIFTNNDNRSNLQNSYKLKGAAYVPYNSRLSESTLNNISMPYYGQQREAGTLLELDPTVIPDFTDYVETSMKCHIEPVYSKSPGGTGSGSEDGPFGTKDWTAKFWSFPDIHKSANNAVYYYGSLGTTNDTQYGPVLGQTYEYLGLTIDSLTVDQNGYLTNDVKGIVGDTFIDMYNIKRTAYSNYTSDSDSKNGVIFQVNYCGISSFPVESSLNFRLRLTGASDGTSYYPKDIYGSAPDTWMDKNYLYDNYLKLNDDYNKKYSKQNFGPTQVDAIPVGTTLVSSNKLIYQTRIAYSEQSLSEDTIDLWRTSLANNYRDLPKNKGGVTNLFTKAEQLYALTRDSLFEVHGSNLNIQTTTSQNIAVGTGTFFSVEPREVMAIQGGYAGSSSKLGVVETPYGHLFVDKIKKKVILFNQSLDDITIEGVTDFWKLNGEIALYNQLPELKKDTSFDNPVNGVGYLAIYDSENIRLLITKLDYELVDIGRYKGIYNTLSTYGANDIYILNNQLTNNARNLSFLDSTTFINKSFTMSYIPHLKQWVSDHSYLPTNYLPHPTGFLSKTQTSNIKIGNQGPMGKFYNSNPDPFIIEIVCNDFPLETKILDSIKINLQSYQDHDINSISTNEFFDSFYIYTEFQNSGSNNLVLDKNLTKKEKDWAINKFFDQVSKNHLTQLFSSTWNNLKSSYPIDKVINTDSLKYDKPWYTLGRLRDKYFSIRFTSNNLENSKFIVNFVSSIFRRSVR